LGAPTTIYELKDGNVTKLTLRPADVGLPECAAEALRGATAAENAESLRAVLSGAAGPLRDFTLLNAAASLVAAELVPDLNQGLVLAANSIDSGAARDRLDAFVRVSNEVG
jgi:anthranilate phosphoribosyltransferase